MRISRVVQSALVLAGLAAASGAQTSANPAWEKLKTLVGAWEGRAADMPVSLTYTLVSNGTSLMESLTAQHETNMVTIYHPDGDSILATHYCAAGNQPRMRAKPTGEPKTLDFEFVDATNVAASTGEVMRRLAVTFQDRDHFQQAWTSRANGKDETTEFVYTRKK